MEAAQRAEAFLRQHGLGERTLLALMPGAAHATKRWPAHHWITLVAQLAQQQVDLVIVGGPAEVELGAQLAQIGGPRVASAAGRFDLAGTAALIKQARCLVGGDTGVTHLATAVGVPVVVLLGPTVGAFGFLPYRARARVIERDLPCRPCTKMGGPVCPLGHHHCLELIPADEVADALARLPQ
jgi:ADP-heptose:LPS heptosyltransferase